jgi:hypothetical protein
LLALRAGEWRDGVYTLLRTLASSASKIPFKNYFKNSALQWQ